MGKISRIIACAWIAVSVIPQLGHADNSFVVHTNNYPQSDTNGLAPVRIGSTVVLSQSLKFDAGNDVTYPGIGYCTLGRLNPARKLVLNPNEVLRVIGDDDTHRIIYLESKNRDVFSYECLYDDAGSVAGSNPLSGTLGAWQIVPYPLPPAPHDNRVFSGKKANLSLPLSSPSESAGEAQVSDASAKPAR